MKKEQFLGEENSLQLFGLIVASPHMGRAAAAHLAMVLLHSVADTEDEAHEWVAEVFSENIGGECSAKRSEIQAAFLARDMVWEAQNGK